MSDRLYFPVPDECDNMLAQRFLRDKMRSFCKNNNTTEKRKRRYFDGRENFKNN